MTTERDPVRAELERRIHKAAAEIGARVIKGQCASLDEYKARCGEAKGLLAAMDIYDAAVTALYGDPDDTDPEDDLEEP